MTANTDVIIALEGYNRKYMTDTAELTADRRDACIFSTPSDTAKLQEYQSFLQQQYPDRVTLEVIMQKLA